MSYYSVLGIGKNFTHDELRKAYRNLCLECHPDRNPGDPRAEERFKEVSIAYQVLSDPEKRRDYDLGSFLGGGRGGPAGNVDADIQQTIHGFMDMFNDFMEHSPLFEEARADADRENARKEKANRKAKAKRAPKKKARRAPAPPKCSDCGDLGYRTMKQGSASFKVACRACPG